MKNKNLNLNKNETETKTSQEGWKVLTQMIIKQIWQTKFLKNEWPSVASKEWIYNCQSRLENRRNWFKQNFTNPHLKRTQFLNGNAKWKH